MLNYRPTGRIRLGRPLKRLLDEAKKVCQGLTRDGWWWWWWTNLRPSRTDISINELKSQCTEKNMSLNYSTTTSFHIFSYSLFNDTEPSSHCSLTYWHTCRIKHKPTNHTIPVACKTGINDPKRAHGGPQRNSCPCLPKRVEGCLLPLAWPAAPEALVSVAEVAPPVGGVTPVCKSLREVEWRRWSRQWSDSGNGIALPVERIDRPALILALWWTSQGLNCGAGTDVSHGVGRLTIRRQGRKCHPC